MYNYIMLMRNITFRMLCYLDKKKKNNIIWTFTTLFKLIYIIIIIFLVFYEHYQNND